MDPTDRVAKRTPPQEKPDEIIARLTVENAEQAQKIAGLEARLLVAESNAAIDPLTGIPNRRVADIELDKKLAEVRRGDRSFLALIFDLDNFKLVNDTYGHDQGDEVLRGFAKKMGTLMRDEDFIARYGGEEFIALIPIDETTTKEQIEIIIRRYLNGVMSINRSNKSEEFDPLNVSIGGVSILPDEVITGADVTKKADELLYASKNSGRNRASLAFGQEQINIFPEK